MMDLKIITPHKKEPMKKLEEWKTNPSKNWKYSVTDTKVLEGWKENIKTHNILIEVCRQYLWHIIPIYKRWFCNFKVAGTVLNHLNSLKLKYPQS